MALPFASPINQLGCVVGDLDKAIDGWVKLGIGPFLVMRNVGLADYVYEGKPSKPRIDVAFGQNGDLQIELIQPSNDEPSSYREFLAQGREGLHHLGWFVDDFDSVAAAMEQEGRPVLQTGDWVGVRFVYLEPASGNGIITELIELIDVSRQLFALVREEAAQWDNESRPERKLLKEAGWEFKWDAARAQVAHLIHRSLR